MPKNTRNGDKSDIEKELEEALGAEEPQEEKRLPEETELEKELDKEMKGENSFEEKEPVSNARRFHELSRKPFKTETELDNAVNGILNEMEQEYFFRGLLKTKKPGKMLLRKGRETFRGETAFQSAKDITQLTRGNLKGTLSTLAKAALKGVQEGATVPPVLAALGFEPGLGAERSREAWQNFVILCEESFDYLAVNLSENADDPIEASRLAFKAFGSALKNVESERKRAATQRTARVSEEGKERKVVGRKAIIVLGLVCIILSASLITAVAFYVPAANTIGTLQSEIVEKDENITALNRQVQVFQDALSQISGEMSTKDSQIANLTASLDQVNADIQVYQSLLSLNESAVIVSNEDVQLNPNTNSTIWNDVALYAGYVIVQAQTTSSTTYAQVVYSAYGVNYDEAIIVGTSGAAAFPVLPGTIEIRIGNSETVDLVNGTVSAAYYY